jgi:glyoxylase-like metal-dependent hydrolase (beta-lactamase superfamily II)
VKVTGLRATLLAVFAALIFVSARGEGTAVRELAPGVFFWQGDHVRKVPANCTWINFKDYVLVIDANFPVAAREIIPLIRKTTADKPIRFLFDTHWHGDHSTANKEYVDAGAVILCSSACDEELRTKGKQAKVPPEPASLTFPDRMVFDDGTHRVELTRMGPAHSKGDAVAYLPKEKILVSGDLCVNWNWGNNVADPDADYDNWIRALDNLAQWDVGTLVPGHGSLGTPATLRAQSAYLADMQKQVRAGLAAGKSADQLAKEVDVSRHGSFGVNPEQNQASVRAMCRRLSPSR